MKKFIVFIIAATLVFTATGCGNLISGIDANKTQIYVYLPDGGYGLNWIKDAATEFNAMEENADYQVIILDHLDGNSGIESKLKAKTHKAHIYFTTRPEIKSLVANGLLIDISDILDQKPDGESGKTIEQKLNNSELYLSAFSGAQGGLYALPYGDSPAGLVFDFELFRDRGWLVTEVKDGKTVPSKGPDGIFDTYDDGQPVNYEQWETLLRKIKIGDKPFLYTTKYPVYTDPIADALFVQYSGIAEYNTFMTYEGTITDDSGTIIDITPQEGYKVYQSGGLLRALEVFNQWLLKPENLHPASSGTTSLTHKEAQNKFILGYKDSQENPQAAFLVEGLWWEAEARATFNTISRQGEPERGYGKRDYRYMLLPPMEGQKGGNGDGTGAVMSVMDSGAAFVVKNDSDAENAMAKKFLAFTCSDKYLKLFTQYCGAIRPFDYTLTEQELSQLTPFQQNLWKLYHDTDNITIIRPSVDKLVSPINYASAKPNYMWYTNINGAGANSVLEALDGIRVSPQQYVQGMRGYYTAARWQSFYNLAFG